MAFVDFLAFQEALLLVAAVIIGFVGVSVYFAMRRNDAAGVKAALKSGAIPVGALGLIATTLSVWGETAWPLPGSYNILFTDVYLLFGLTLVILAVSMAFSLKLVYAGMFALVAGGITIGYGWNGYILSMTKDPFETFLLYVAFGSAGIFSFPATVITDHFLAHPDGTAFTFGAATAAPRSRPSLQGATRAAQPVIPGTDPEPTATDTEVRGKFHVPAYITATLWFFVLVVGLAGLAAFLYLQTTIPAHLASAP